MYNSWNYAHNGQICTAPNMQYLTEATNYINTITGYQEAVEKHIKLAKNQADINQLNAQSDNLKWRLILKLNDPLWGDMPNINCWLPEDLDQVTCHIAGVSGWNRVSVLVASLGYLCAPLRGRYRLQVHTAWEEPLVLYQFIIASSGERKTLVNNLLSEPLVKFQESLMAGYTKNRPEKEQFSNLVQKAYTIAQNHWVKDIVKDNYCKDTGINIANFNKKIQRVAENTAGIIKLSDTIPKSPSFLADKFTEKQLIRMMAGAGGGQAILQPEGTALIKRLVDSKFDPMIFLKSYDMEDIDYQNMTSKPLHVINPFLNILVFMQPNVAINFYKNSKLAGSGASARFLPYYSLDFYPPSISYDTYHESVMGIYNEKIQKMLMRNYTQDSNREIFRIVLDSNARQIVEAFQQQLYREFTNNNHPESLKALIRKLAGSAVRIAGVLHAWLFDEPEKYLVSQTTMQTGIEIALLFKKHAEYIFSPHNFLAMEDAKKIAQWILRHRHLNFTSKDAAQYSGVKTNDKIFPALDYLEQRNILTQLVLPNKPRMCLVHPDFFNQNQF